MATSPILTAAGNLANVANTVAAQAQAITNAGSVANTTDLWPVQNWGTPPRLTLAGVPGVEQVYHQAFEQGRFLERSNGDAMTELMTKKVDLDEKIQQYLNMNKLALDGQLPDAPRAIKFAADSVAFVQQIRTFSNTQTNILSGLQANVQALLASEMRMLNMISANQNALSNLLNEICNWGLPPLPSLAAQLGAIWHWNGFNFNAASGFNFKALSASVNFSFPNFSFSSCQVRTPNLAPVFGSTPSSVADGDLTFGTGTLPPPVANGTYGDPSQFTDPAYIAEQQAITTAVFNPALVVANNGTSLPTPASIISNYALPPATYQANVVSAVPELGPVIIQPNDADFNQATPSPARVSTLRGLSIRYLTLGQIVTSKFDPNLTAAWLFYIGLNRTGRAGNWLANMQAAYTELITPSLTYLATNPVPWNEVLGGTGVSDAPAAIPLIASMQGEDADNVLWKLSFIEAALLGYARNTTWDSAADTTFLNSFTGSDLDYVPTTVNATPTATTILGVGTASFPVSCTYPQSIAGVLQQVIAIAAANIAATPSFQSTRPQFRFTYDMFAQATLVDRFSQFWREFNANLGTLLTQDPYLVSFVVSYPLVLDSAIDPLADPSIYTALQADAATRNRSWVPGVDLLPIPSAIVLATAPTAPTTQSNGWPNGELDAAAYLSRPDVQAQSIPAQMAMLRTNQSYAALMTLSGNLQTAVAAAVANANLTASSIGLPGWEIETNVVTAIPPGAAGFTLNFGKVDFDQSGYVQDPATVEIQSTNPYILNAVLNWDTTGDVGTRTVMLLQNGLVIATASGNADSPTPYTVQFSTLLSLNLDDILQVVASHSLTTPQSLLSGSSFLGLLDTSATQADTQPVSSGPASSGAVNYVSGALFNAFTAVSQNTDGKVYPTDPTTTVPGVTPFVDGIAIQGSTAVDESVSVAVAYGTIFNAPGMTWTEGGLLYVGPGGVLTQDFTNLAATTRWIIVVGKAVSSTSFIFEPHIPTNYVLNF